MPKYRSKPQIVEAVQWTGDNLEDVLRAIPDKTARRQSSTVFPSHLGLYLLAGKDGAQEWVPVPIGHWLVHPPGDLSDVWPVEDEYFKAKYELYEF